MYADDNYQGEQEQGITLVGASIETIREYLTPEIITTGVMGFFTLCILCATNGRVLDFKLGPMSMKIM